MKAREKRRLEHNEEVSISVNKNIFCFVGKPGGYDNLTFNEKDFQNYFDKAHRLWLGMGDAEATDIYFPKMQNNNS